MSPNVRPSADSTGSAEVPATAASASATRTAVRAMWIAATHITAS